MVFLDYVLYEQYEPLLQQFKYGRRFSGVDSYIEKAYPPGHDFYARFEADRAYWHHLFTRNRRKEAKGFLLIRYDNES